MGFRKQAATILQVRSRPNWLLTSLVLASVMVSEGLPLVLDHLFKPGSYGAFIVSTIAVALVGQIIPQLVMPLYILEFGGRCVWFVKITMWLMAPFAFPFAYALKIFRTGRARRKPINMDGVLEINELVEFVRLHEQSEKRGGTLGDAAGSMVRSLMENSHGLVGQDVRPWSAVTLLNANSPVSPTILEKIKTCDDPYVLVSKSNARYASSQHDENDGRPATIYGIKGAISIKVYTPECACCVSLSIFLPGIYQI